MANIHVSVCVGGGGEGGGKFGCGPYLPRLKWPNLPPTDYFQISRDSFF